MLLKTALKANITIITSRIFRARPAQMNDNQVVVLFFFSLSF